MQNFFYPTSTTPHHVSDSLGHGHARHRTVVSSGINRNTLSSSFKNINHDHDPKIIRPMSNKNSSFKNNQKSVYMTMSATSRESINESAIKAHPSISKEGLNYPQYAKSSNVHFGTQQSEPTRIVPKKTNEIKPTYNFNISPASNTIISPPLKKVFSQQKVHNNGQSRQIYQNGPYTDRDVLGNSFISHSNGLSMGSRSQFNYSQLFQQQQRPTSRFSVQVQSFQPKFPTKKQNQAPFMSNFSTFTVTPRKSQVYFENSNSHCLDFVDHPSPVKTSRNQQINKFDFRKSQANFTQQKKEVPNFRLSAVQFNSSNLSNTFSVSNTNQINQKNAYLSDLQDRQYQPFHHKPNSEVSLSNQKYVNFNKKQQKTLFVENNANVLDSQQKSQRERQRQRQREKEHILISDIRIKHNNLESTNAQKRQKEKTVELQPQKQEKTKSFNDNEIDRFLFFSNKIITENEGKNEDIYASYSLRNIAPAMETRKDFYAKDKEEVAVFNPLQKSFKESQRISQTKLQKKVQVKANVQRKEKVKSDKEQMHGAFEPTDLKSVEKKLEQRKKDEITNKILDKSSKTEGIIVSNISVKTSNKPETEREGEREMADKIKILNLTVEQINIPIIPGLDINGNGKGKVSKQNGKGCKFQAKRSNPKQESNSRISLIGVDGEFERNFRRFDNSVEMNLLNGSSMLSMKDTDSRRKALQSSPFSEESKIELGQERKAKEDSNQGGKTKVFEVVGRIANSQKNQQNVSEKTDPSLLDLWKQQPITPQLRKSVQENFSSIKSNNSIALKNLIHIESQFKKEKNDETRNFKKELSKVKADATEKFHSPSHTSKNRLPNSSKKTLQSDETVRKSPIYEMKSGNPQINIFSARPSELKQMNELDEQALEAQSIYLKSTSAVSINLLPLASPDLRKDDPQSPHLQSRTELRKPFSKSIIVPMPLLKDDRKFQIRDFELGQTVGSGRYGDVVISRDKKTNFILSIYSFLQANCLERHKENFEIHHIGSRNH